MIETVDTNNASKCLPHQLTYWQLQYISQAHYYASNNQLPLYIQVVLYSFEMPHRLYKSDFDPLFTSDLQISI